MSDDRHAAIPLRNLPDPALAYAVDGDDAHVTATNDAFERRFGGAPPDRRVSTVFERCRDCETPGDDDPLTHLVRGDQAGIRLDGCDGEDSFLVRVIPSNDAAGYLVFTDPTEWPDGPDGPDVDQVSSVISHDLRNPLDVAKAHLRAARETGEPEHFESVADAHDRMERIIRDVLTLTRDGTVIRPSEGVSIEAASREAWESIDADGADLTVSESLPTVTADPDRLRRLLENLFRNSVEHGSTGGRDPSEPGDSAEHGVSDGRTEDGVTVTVRPFEDGFSVADDGPGIPSGKRDVVFTPGYSTHADGTGLGLAIVERIVEAHGWDVTLTAAEGGGARFEISI
ncbi:sensor histidine kinase [Halorubrum halodurans]|uniref:histidine kinase n=1 Tax=Halorubrum halodurans TaxID=1383851 RepID=A0A256IPD2_9EURY|nr:HAMP domain-containing sensor histidine kinase [Halorubrum halodurans]OYR58404.1 two-component sensor histidine kinase [Halorubrum halodurans]